MLGCFVTETACIPIGEKNTLHFDEMLCTKPTHLDGYLLLLVLFYFLMFCTVVLAICLFGNKIVSLPGISLELDSVS